jgi:hypothetical protein
MASLKFVLFGMVALTVILNVVLATPSGIPEADKEKQIGFYGDDPYERLFTLLENADGTIRKINSKIHQCKSFLPLTSFPSSFLHFQSTMPKTGGRQAFVTLQSAILGPLSSPK